RQPRLGRRQLHRIRISGPAGAAAGIWRAYRHSHYHVQHRNVLGQLLPQPSLLRPPPLLVPALRRAAPAAATDGPSLSGTGASWPRTGASAWCLPSASGSTRALGAGRAGTSGISDTRLSTAPAPVAR